MGQWRLGWPLYFKETQQAKMEILGGSVNGMVDVRRWLLGFAALGLITGLVTPASAQNGLICTASAPAVTPTSTPPQPTLRQEGFTELTADILLTCVGAPGATPTQSPNTIPQANITVSLNAPVTSRILAGGTSSTPLTEALLLVDDPSPGTPYPALGNQNPCLSALNPAAACQVVGDGGQTFNQPGKFNVFQGIGGGPGSSSITFQGVPVDPPGPALASRKYRITNVRVDATTIGANNFSPIFAVVSASLGSSIQIDNPQNSVGFVSYGLTTGTSVVGAPFQQCQSCGMTQVGTVTFTEDFATAFKVAGLIGQNMPGTVYYTESGLEIAVTGTAGPADTGTMLQVAISGIPAGVSVWVDDWAQSTGAVGCTSSTSNAGCTTLSDATLVAGTVNVPNGDPGVNVPQQALPGSSATFVWAVTNTNPLAIDSLSFNIYASVSAGAAAGTVTALSGFSPQQPLAISPMTGPIPEFSSTVNVPASATTLFTVSPCVTISGQVTLSGVGISGVTVTLGGSQSGSATTDGSGNYSFTVPAGGNYTVMPLLAGYTFNPPGLSYNSLSGSQTANFAALQPQTITFGPLSNQVFGIAPFAVAATASSGLAVSFASTTPPVCTVVGATVTLAGVGTCTIQATQAGNASYAAATPVNRSFQVKQGSQTITFGPLSNQPYGAAPFTVGATASSGLTVRFNSQTPYVCGVSGTTVTLAAVGTCTIRATQAGNASYAAATPVNQSFQVTKGTQTITFAALPNQPYGAAPFMVSAAASSGLAVRFFSMTPGVCTVAGTTVTLVLVGTCTIRATQAGNTDYAAATPVDQSFQVTKGTQTITFAALPNQPYGAAPFTVSATASSGLTVRFNSQTPYVCGISGTTVTPAAVGTCTVEATQPGNAKYAAATPVNQSFQVTKLSQTITFAALPNQVYGAAPFKVSATASSGLTVRFTSQTPSVCGVSGTTVTLAAVGTCTVQATQPGNATYAAATPGNQSFLVTLPQCFQPQVVVPLPPTAASDPSMTGILAGFTNINVDLSLMFPALYSLSGSQQVGYCAQSLLLTRYLPQSNTFLAINNKVFEPEELAASGTVVSGITLSAVNTQLAAAGYQPIIDVNHEIIRLPDGSTAFLGHTERLFTGVQSPAGVTVDVLGDSIIVVDPSWTRVTWYWNSFDWLPVNRPAILGETCGPTAVDRCPIKLAAQANDWLHSNALFYDPADGNLGMSIRHQDWVVKIAYQNGAGDGHLLWKLGYQGDFSNPNVHGVANPWFSHQHDTELDAQGNIVLFDNGNTRRSTDPTALSRGQVWILDTQAMTADLALNYSMNVYSDAYGTAQQLPNGNYWFVAGRAHVLQNINTQMVELVPQPDASGVPAMVLEMDTTVYRAPRVPLP